MLAPRHLQTSTPGVLTFRFTRRQSHCVHRTLPALLSHITCLYLGRQAPSVFVLPSAQPYSKLASQSPIRQQQTEFSGIIIFCKWTTQPFSDQEESMMRGRTKFVLAVIAASILGHSSAASPIFFQQFSGSAWKSIFKQSTDSKYSGELVAEVPEGLTEPALKVF